MYYQLKNIVLSYNTEPESEFNEFFPLVTIFFGTDKYYLVKIRLLPDCLFSENVIMYVI